MPDMTLAEAEQQYASAMERAKDKPEVLSQLKVERAQAVAEIRLRDAAIRELALAKREALLEFPLAREVQEHVVGETEDDIKASAKAWHERLTGLVEKHHRDIEVRKLVEAQLNGNTKPPEGTNGPGEAVQQP